MDHKEKLTAMLQDFIAGKEEQAAVTLHDYFVSKSREVTGLQEPVAAEAADDEVIEQE